jgi:hypothetical protein
VKEGKEGQEAGRSYRSLLEVRNRGFIVFLVSVSGKKKQKSGKRAKVGSARIIGNVNTEKRKIREAR